MFCCQAGRLASQSLTVPAATAQRRLGRFSDGPTPGGAVVAASARGQAQLASALDDARRAAAHGIRSVPIADIGVLAAFSAMRDAGLLPREMQAVKIAE